MWPFLGKVTSGSCLANMHRPIQHKVMQLGLYYKLESFSTVYAQGNLSTMTYFVYSQLFMSNQKAGYFFCTHTQ